MMFYTYFILSLGNIFQPRYTRGVLALLTHEEVVRLSGLRVLRVMVFNAIFNNILGISERSVLLVEETGVPGENHRSSQVTNNLYQIMLYRVHLACGNMHCLHR